MGDPERVWQDLDPAAEPVLVWVRPVDAPEVVLLLGAFDPPTRAHVALLRAAGRHTGLPAAFCMTKALLDRPPDELLVPVERVDLLAILAEEQGLGFALCNRGTYLGVCEAADVDVRFVIGSDKLPQLRDPSFYEDGQAGVRRTFERCRFLVVPRGEEALDAPEDVTILDPARVFDDPSVGAISGTAVRSRVREGRPVGGLVPASVHLALRGYTELAE